MVGVGAVLSQVCYHGIKKASQPTGQQREASFPFDQYGNAAHSLFEQRNTETLGDIQKSE